MGSALLQWYFDEWSRDDADEFVARHASALSVEEPLLSLPDAALLGRLRDGDRGALEELFRTYAMPLEQFARTLLRAPDVSADVVQDVFVHLWETRDRVAPRTSWRAYLFGALRHRVYNLRRAVRVRDMHAAAAGEEWGTSFERPDRGVDDDELRRLVASVLATLTPRVREIAALRWGAYLSYREIAAMLGISERTVNTQLTTAARALRQQLESYWHDR
jgi:RNA polymerase sigma-70 factor (ECF subfamily)